MKIRTSVLKLILDILMFVTLMLLYSKNVISLTFHELTGLIVLFVMLFHVLINGKWVCAVTKKMFDKSFSVRTKFLWVMDFLLLICTLAMLVTSFLISKALLPNFLGGHNSLIPFHFFFAALLVILLGIHVGLHFKYIANVISKKKKQRKATKITAIIAAVLIAVAGIYSISTTSYIRWIKAPFSTTQIQGHGSGNGQRQGHGSGNGQRQGGGQHGKPQEPQKISAKKVAGVFGTTTAMTLLFGIIAFTVEECVERKKRGKNETNQIVSASLN